MYINIHLIEMVVELLKSKSESIKLKEHEKITLRGIERSAQGGELKTDGVIDGLERIKTLDENFDKRDFRDLADDIKKILKS